MIATKMAGMVPLPVSSAVQHNTTAGNPQYTTAPSTTQSSGGGETNEGKIRELALQIHGKIVQAQQLKTTAQQQQQQQQSITANQQISQAEEMSKRLKEAVLCLQEAIQDLPLVGLKERLKVMAMKLDLKFDIQQSELTSIFLMCEAFYIEILCQDNGYVVSLKLAQANQQVESEVLTELVRSHKFGSLESHLQSLKDFYAQSNSSTRDPLKMYRVLSSLESVFLSITKMSPQASLCETILNNPLGHVIPRSAGLPMKLTFFVHPYEVQKRLSLFSSYPSDTEQEHQVDGLEVSVSATVLLESSNKVYNLSTDPNLFDVSKATFFQVVPQKSVNISVSYVLHISRNLPVCGTVVKELHNMVYSAEQNFQPLLGPHINQLIAKETATSKGVEVCTSKSRVVCLPSQRHHYYMPSELKSHDLSHDQDYPSSECGVMMSKVTFLHPVHIFNLVTLLRKQLVYNTLVSSLLGRGPKGLAPASSEEVEFVFEVSTHPADSVTVVVDMQDDGDYLAVEFNIPDQQPTHPVVKVKFGKDATPMENQQLSVIAERCMSVPVTMYSIMKRPQLLGGGAAEGLLQNYLQTIHNFNTQLSIGGVKGHAEMGGVEVERGTIGMKRKRTD